MKRVKIIGSGFASIAAACYLAQAGYQVSVYEKNKEIGGRASQFRKDGFTFDMGPTWYWMLDVFEKFFNDFGKTPSDFYDLEKLDPGYEVYFDKMDSFKISRNLPEIYALFEKTEKGSSKHLQLFLRQAKRNYEIAVQNLVYKPDISPLELISSESISRLYLLFRSIKSQIRKNIKNPRLRKILEFPVLFLGAKPSNTPALWLITNLQEKGVCKYTKKLW